MGVDNIFIRVYCLFMSEWRNGSRNGLKIRWEKSREGSSPSFDTTLISSEKDSVLNFFMTNENTEKCRKDISLFLNA
jgi:hypothetical protein